MDPDVHVSNTDLVGVSRFHGLWWFGFDMLKSVPKLCLIEET